MKAIILAAGRGSRMKTLTADRPKCLLPLAGKPLLQWQMEALRAAGATEILVVRGYLGHMLTPDALPWAEVFSVAENPRWQQTNMLYTLRCADAYIRSAFASGVQRVIVSYADIVYCQDHVRALAQDPHDISITYDELWENLWKLRFGDPLLDAETFLQKDGMVHEIGGKPQSLADIHGQYMGLLSFTQRGWDKACEVCTARGDALDTTDMTTFLREILKKNVPVGAVPVRGRWCEADNEDDLVMYNQSLAKGQWTHDWR